MRERTSRGSGAGRTPAAQSRTPGRHAGHVHRAVVARDTSRARAAGLVTRPLDETLTDTLAWELARPEPGPHGAGLTDKEERSLLDFLTAPSAS